MLPLAYFPPAASPILSAAAATISSVLPGPVDFAMEIFFFATGRMVGARATVRAAARLADFTFWPEILYGGIKRECTKPWHAVLGEVTLL